MAEPLPASIDAVFTALPGIATRIADPLGHGCFIALKAERALARHVFSLGQLSGADPFLALYRHKPWWTKPKTGSKTSEIPSETQFLLLESGQGYAAILPLVDRGFHIALEGDEGGNLLVVADSDDPSSTAADLTCLFVAVGDDPYRLLSEAAESIVARLGTTRLRRDKTVPEFIRYFGWCTWDAFYGEVSHEKIREGLISLTKNEVAPGLMILDDGWLSVEKKPSDEERLVAFAANGKFPGDLGATVAMAKKEFGVRRFLAWHAFQGYWGGIDAQKLPYRVHETDRQYGPGVKKNAPWACDPAKHGLIQPSDALRFYNDFHRHLKSQGVDGVKVDNQATIESYSHGLGARVEVQKALHDALESSAIANFAGNMINCMSLTTDVIFNAADSVVCRNSEDFNPIKLEMQGTHLCGNTFNALWVSQFMLPDWDMFQSGIPSGSFHAAARAISGGPVYISDKPEEHDAALIRSLMFSDRTVPLTRQPALPCRDGLFTDPSSEDVLLKIFSLNSHSGVVGLFNARHHEATAERKEIVGSIAPSNVEGLAGEDFAVYCNRSGMLTRLGRDEYLVFSLTEGAWELATIVAIEQGFAPIGLTDKLNSGGTIVARDGKYVTLLYEGGDFLAWCARKPKEVLLDGQSSAFAYDHATGALRVKVPLEKRTVRVLP